MQNAEYAARVDAAKQRAALHWIEEYGDFELTVRFKLVGDKTHLVAEESRIPQE